MLKYLSAWVSGVGPRIIVAPPTRSESPKAIMPGQPVKEGMVSRLGPHICTIGVACLIVLGLSACGSTTSTNTVAHVGNRPITKSSLSHWMAISVGIRNFTSPPPAGSEEVVPDPPNFTACIARRRRTAPNSASPTAKLRADCQSVYTELEQAMLHTLIKAEWVRGEAANEGVQVSDAEVMTRFSQIKQKQFPKDATYQRFLATTHQSTADILFSLETQLLGTKLEQKASQGKTRKAAQAALSSAVTSFEARWKARTSCAPAYVMKDCREFK